MKTRIVAALAGAILLATTAIAQNVSPKRHPNLAAAQRFANQAYSKVTAAQEANEFDLGGHAAKAKQLLEQVNAELKLAAETANHR